MPHAPRPRLVTYSPALTQMTYDLGLGDHVVGVTTECDLPPGRDVPRVGNAYRPRAEPILAVQPDVVLIQMQPKEFDPLRQIDPDVRIEHFTIETIADIPPAMSRICRIAGRDDLADRHVEEFNAALEAVRKRVEGLPRPRALFVMGYQQPSTGGAGTFINDMIELAGGVNAAQRYRGWVSLNAEAVLACRPEVIVCQLLSSTERPEEARRYWSQVLQMAGPAARVLVETDRGWTIPSRRTPQYAQRLAAMIHPDADGGPNR